MSDPEIIDDDERAIERRGPVDLMQLPRLLGGALTDLRTIAEHITTLPGLLVNLEHINERVSSLDEEVKQMRAAVEAMGGDVVELSHRDRPPRDAPGRRHPRRPPAAPPRPARPPRRVTPPTRA